MIGINYRYEINPARPGVVKLGFTKRTIIATLVLVVLSWLPFLAILGLAEIDDRKTAARSKNTKKSKKR